MNKEYQIRLLQTDEFDLVEQLAGETNSLMRNKNFNKLPTTDSGIYCGTFNKTKELIAFIAVFRWKLLPYYTIGQYYSKPGLMNVFSWKNNPAIEMTEYIIDIMEKEGRYTWYYARSIEKWPTKLRIKGNDFFSISKKCKTYVRYMEETIPKNTVSIHEGHRRQLPEIAWPYDVIMVKCCLKNKFRPFAYKFEEDYNEN